MPQKDLVLSVQTNSVSYQYGEQKTFRNRFRQYFYAGRSTGCAWRNFSCK